MLLTVQKYFLVLSEHPMAYDMANLVAAFNHLYHSNQSLH